MTHKKQAAPFNELEFIDQMDCALRTANSLVRTVMDAIAEDADRSHLFVTLDSALDALGTAKELKDEWNDKCRLPRAIEAKKLEDAARDAEPSKPMTPAQCDHLQALVDKSRKAHGTA
jgi:hypothetical protein